MSRFALTCNKDTCNIYPISPITAVCNYMCAKWEGLYPSQGSKTFVGIFFVSGCVWVCGNALCLSIFVRHRRSGVARMNRLCGHCMGTLQLMQCLHRGYEFELLMKVPYKCSLVTIYGSYVRSRTFLRDDRWSLCDVVKRSLALAL